MLSELQHFSFCRRQWALIHLEQQWAENLLTIQGLLMHEKAHSETTEKRGGKIIVRRLHVCSHRLKLTGICDVVEFDENSDGISIHGHKETYRVTPVEYKRGRPKEHNADALQLCAQAVCLEEMLCCHIPRGFLYYGEPRRRTEVELTEALREETAAMLREIHDCRRRGHTPKAKPDSRCGACSLKEFCQPKLLKNQHSSAKAYIRQTLSKPKGDIRKSC